jgi:23S rRNA (guanosine2251-2'-O)-methyltransferase
MIATMIAKSRDVRLLLDNIRSVHNVGSIFRTAETLGITHIYCMDTTPAPTDRFGQKRKDFAKVSLGAEDIITWEAGIDSVSVVKKLKKEGFQIVALEQATYSVDYKKVKPPANRKGNMLIILGNEVEGVSKSLLKLADIVAEIPLRGKKESLNVSVAAGIFLYRLLDR